MGKITRRILLGMVSALGVYYYKNPKEAKKHKDILLDNVKLGLEKLNETKEKIVCAEKELEEKLKHEEIKISEKEEPKKEADEFIEKSKKLKQKLHDRVENFKETHNGPIYDIRRKQPQVSSVGPDKKEPLEKGEKLDTLLTAFEEKKETPKEEMPQSEKEKIFVPAYAPEQADDKKENTSYLKQLEIAEKKAKEESSTQKEYEENRIKKEIWEIKKRSEKEKNKGMTMEDLVSQVKEELKEDKEIPEKSKNALESIVEKFSRNDK